ncbi:MAG: hypothetical protein ACAI43_02750 [Phycisphaerae bacterium]|nr:hypothetical protein [Tepidisphaeraceae bacterium]
MDATPPKPKSEIHVIRKRDLRDPSYRPAWEDPEKIATFTAEKRLAILSNPLSRSDDDPVQIVGTVDGRAAGRMDLFAGEVSTGGQAVPVLWTSLLHVPVEHRSSLLGVLLILKMQALCPTVAACAVSQQALPVYEKLKWIDFRMPRYVLMRRSRAVVERYVGRGPIGMAARVVADAALLGWRGMLRLRTAIRTRGLRVEHAERAPAELDAAIATSAGAAQPVTITRSADWINWLLTSAIGSFPRDRQGLFLVRDRAGALVGYFLLKAHVYPTATHRNFKNLFLGSLKDWQSFRPSALSFHDIVRLAVRELGRWNVDAVEVCVTDPADGHRLRRFGFLPAGDLHLLYRAAPKSPLADPALAGQAKWNIRPADGDNFFG